MTERTEGKGRGAGSGDWRKVREGSREGASEAFSPLVASSHVNRWKEEDNQLVEESKMASDAEINVDSIISRLLEGQY